MEDIFVHFSMPRAIMTTFVKKNDRGHKWPGQTVEFKGGYSSLKSS